jgi:nucleotide-binding universal stress UspA family protein
MNFKRVLIAVDESKYSKRAAEVGILMANELNAEIAMINVITPLSTIGSLDAEILPVDIETISIDTGKQLLEELSLAFSFAGEINKVVKIGDPAIEILKFANSWSAELIVIGRHGLESFKHLIFGGVVDEVATHTKVPVLLIPFDENK